MQTLIHISRNVSTILTQAQAEDYVKRFNAEAGETWTYKAVQIGDTKGYRIACYDEEKFFLGYI